MRTRNICDIYFITHSLLPLSDCLPHFLLSALHFSSLYPPPLEGHQTGSVHPRSRGIKLAVYYPHPLRGIRLAVFTPALGASGWQLITHTPSGTSGWLFITHTPSRISGWQFITQAPSGASGCQFICPLQGHQAANLYHPTPSGASEAGSLYIPLPFRLIRLAV